MKNISEELAYRKYVNKRKALMIDGVEIHAKVEQFEELGLIQERRQWQKRAGQIESVSQIMQRIGKIAEREFRAAFERAKLLAE